VVGRCLSEAVKLFSAKGKIRKQQGENDSALNPFITNTLLFKDIESNKIRS